MFVELRRVELANSLPGTFAPRPFRSLAHSLLTLVPWNFARRSEMALEFSLRYDTRKYSFTARIVNILIVPLRLLEALIASHQSVETPQQEVWLYPHHLGLWKELGFCDVLQLVHPRLSVCVWYAAWVNCGQN